MLKPIILQITIIAIILFIIVSYFINSRHDKDVIDNIIEINKEDTEISDDKIYEIQMIRDKYLKEKFKVCITRSIIFGALLFFAINYLNPRKPPINMGMGRPCPNNMMEMPMNNRSIPIDQIIPIQGPVGNFFNEAPW